MNHRSAQGVFFAGLHVGCVLHNLQRCVQLVVRVARGQEYDARERVGALRHAGQAVAIRMPPQSARIWF